MADKIEKIIADTFLQMAEGLETGNFGKKPRIALTGMGSEHGEENAMEAAKMAAKDGIDVYYIGTLEADGVTTVKVADDEEGHKKMEEMLASHEVDGAVTMHFPFPIGVSTVGRVVTPAKGREMFIANTTGTSSSDRIEGMIKNTIYGIIAAKACGKEHPTVGILNVDGARQTEMALKELEKRNIPGEILTTNYLNFSEPKALEKLNKLRNITLKMYDVDEANEGFHTKGYIFKKEEIYRIIIGSSNMTKSALTTKLLPRTARIIPCLRAAIFIRENMHKHMGIGVSAPKANGSRLREICSW